MKQKDKSVNGYSLSRQWYDFAFENQDKVNPIHGCLYLWLVELNNRLGWVERFASPASQAMAAIGIKRHKSYKKAFDDLVTWGLVRVVQKAKNQYTANVISLRYSRVISGDALSNSVLSASDNLYKAEDNCYVQNDQCSDQSTAQSTAHILKPETLKPETIQEDKPDKPAPINMPFVIVKEFKKIFPDYVEMKKDYGMAKQLTELWKKKYPSYDSEDKLIQTLKEYFIQCQSIPDKYHHNKMSLSHIVGNFNEINRILRDNNKKGMPRPIGTPGEIEVPLNKL